MTCSVLCCVYVLFCSGVLFAFPLCWPMSLQNEVLYRHVAKRYRSLLPCIRYKICKYCIRDDVAGMLTLKNQFVSQQLKLYQMPSTQCIIAQWFKTRENQGNSVDTWNSNLLSQAPIIDSHRLCACFMPTSLALKQTTAHTTIRGSMPGHIGTNSIDAIHIFLILRDWT